MRFGDYGEDYLVDLAEASEQHPLLEAMYYSEFDFQRLNRYAEFLESYVDEHEDGLPEGAPLLAFTFSLTLAESLLYTTFSVLDSSLRELCTASQRTFRTQLTYEDCKGSTILQSMNYLTEAVGLFSLKHSQNRKLLLAWRSVRKCFIHNSGKVRNDFDRMAVRRVGLNLENDSIQVQVTDVSQFADTSYVFIHDVFDQLMERAGQL